MVRERNSVLLRNTHAEDKANRREAEINRSRGILSKTDREFLFGIKEYKHPQTETNRRSEIRTRVENGIKDFGLLVDLLGEKERKRIFEALDDSEYGSIDEFAAVVIEFLYQGIGEDPDRLEDIIARALYGIERESPGVGGYQGKVQEITTDIEIKRGYDADAIYERYKGGRGHGLSPAEIGVLLLEGKLSDDELDDLTPPEGEDGLHIPHRHVPDELTPSSFVEPPESNNTESAEDEMDSEE